MTSAIGWPVRRLGAGTVRTLPGRDPKGYGRRVVPRDRKARCVAALLLSIAAHAALLMATGGASTGPAAGSGPVTARAVLQLRLDSAPGSSTDRPSRSSPVSAASSPDRQFGDSEGPDAPPIAISPGERYYTAAEVDRRAYPVTPIDLASGGLGPLDPRAAAKVTLQIWIDEDGHVRNAKVVASNMPSGIAKEAAEAFATTHYQPAIRRGERVKTVIRVEVEYAGATPLDGGYSAAIGR